MRQPFINPEILSQFISEHQPPQKFKEADTRYFDDATANQHQIDIEINKIKSKQAPKEQKQALLELFKLVSDEYENSVKQELCDQYPEISVEVLKQLKFAYVFKIAVQECFIIPNNTDKLEGNFQRDTFEKFILPPQRSSICHRLSNTLFQPAQRQPNAFLKGPYRPIKPLTQSAEPRPNAYLVMHCK